MSEAYTEAARTYRGPAITLAILLAGFGLDAILGGAVAHLPGWVIAIVVVAGTHALLVRAANSTQSLRIDEDAVRVGEAALERADLGGLRAGIDPTAPVLGWTVAPKAPKGVTLRLRDGREVGVLTRYPDAVANALGLAPAAEEGPAPVRPATSADLPLLAEIDDRAAAVFRVAGYHLPDVDYPLPPPKAVFVIGDPPEAFVWLDEVDGAAYVAEISVLPARMRQGLGSRLMAAAEEWARGSGYDRITLTTYAEVPWNAPWYATRGYAEWDQPGPGLQAIRAQEREIGLDEVGRRIVMRRDL